LENFYKEEPDHIDLSTDKAKEKLDKLFDASFEKVKEQNPAVRKELMDQDRDWARNMIERAILWTQQENRTVLATEKRFGTTDDTVETTGLKLNVKGREFRLQGSIDRVDRLPGTNGTDGDIVVLDYKTGDVKKMQREKELHLQDYLYPLALKTLEPGKYDIKNAGYLMLEKDVQYLPGNDQKEKTEKMIYGLLEWMDDESRAKEAAPGFHLSQDGKKLELASAEERENIFKGCRNYCKLVAICPMNRKEEDNDDA
jgi:RecB family exonuclease